MKTLIIDWIKQNKYWILLAALLIIGFIVKTVMSDYNSKQFAYLQQQIKENKKPQNIARLILKKSYFEKTYGSQLAQQLLENGNIVEAKILTTNAINRLNDELPSYAKFAKASLLVYEKKYEEALQLSNELNEELKNDKTSSLAIYNLRRLNNLQQLALKNTDFKPKNGY
jgi:hypothetical protein